MSSPQVTGSSAKAVRGPMASSSTRAAAQPGPEQKSPLDPLCTVKPRKPDSFSPAAVAYATQSAGASSSDPYVNGKKERIVPGVGCRMGSQPG